MASSVIQVDQPDDPRLADYVRLRDTSLRKHLEATYGLFLAEGEKVIRRAVEAGHRPRSFLLAERWLPGLRDVLDAHPEAPVYVVSEALAEQVTGFHVHRGALASLHRDRGRDADELLGHRRLVVLEDIVDHTNVGAILRNAAGLGWDGALLSPRTADPLYRRAIKVSMGAVFSLPWARLADWYGAVARLRTSGFRTVALTPAGSAVDLGQLTVDPQDRIALLLGTEGAGLSTHWAEAADVTVRIPMSVGIDSLNVAAAAAIACYTLSSASSSSSSSERSRGVTGQSSG